MTALDKTFKTCQGCQNRSLTCRAGCAGWQHREEEKQERYRRAQQVRGGWMDSPLIIGYAKKRHKRQKLGKKG